MPRSSARTGGVLGPRVTQFRSKRSDRLWVGNKVTPGTTEASHQAIEAIRDNDRNRAGIASPAQLTSCPWCGTEIQPGRDIEVDRTLGRTAIYCGDKLSQRQSKIQR